MARLATAFSHRLRLTEFPGMFYRFFGLYLKEINEMGVVADVPETDVGPIVLEGKKEDVTEA